MVFTLIVTALGMLILSATGEGNKICQSTHHQDAKDDFLAFFGVTDGLDITWLHATNSPEKLEQGLSGDIMMLEADVLMRNNMVNGTPVMAHPQAVDSNLTLESFLIQTTKSTKGIKLDFKTIEVVEPSLKMIQNITSGETIENPIWLNADILPGPCYDKVCVPVDHVRFLSLCKSYFPNGTLSISWKTGSNMTAPENYYNWSQVLPMGQLVSEIAQPITFPVRAVLVRRSWEQLHWLLDLSETFTITIWSSTSDNLDVRDLVALRQSVSHKRIYYDLPPDQKKAFKKALASSSGSSRGGSKSFSWEVNANKDCKDVLIGHNSVMFSGEGGQVISEKVLYEVSANQFSLITGNVSFIKTDGEDAKKSITIKLHVKDATGEAINSNSLVTLVMHSSGDFQFSLSNGDDKQGSVESENGVFKFEITESASDGNQRSFRCDITAQDSKEEEASVSFATESKPVGGYALIIVGAQSDAILVQNVITALAMPETAGASTMQRYFRISAVLLLALLYIFLQI
ncbi:hypothetical protein ACROYT_G043708 [Oculina patagonica]